MRDLSVETLVHVVDILLVAFVNYKLLAMIKGTRAWRIVLGIFLFVALLVLSNFLQLTTLHWMLDKATMLAPVALVILLLPEMRAAIEGIGKLGGWTEKLVAPDSHFEAHTIEEIVAAISEMSVQRTGSIIVLERTAALDDIILNGVQLEARVSAALLCSIFYEGNPLHDGAAVVRGDKVVAAACRLPLSENRMDPSHHMRHRAAVGISEQHDCLVVVTSEERGTISISMDGKISKLASPHELRDLLNRELRKVTAERNGQATRRAKRSKTRSGK